MKYIKGVILESSVLLVTFFVLWYFTKWELMDMVSFCFFCAIAVSAPIFFKSDKEKKEKTREMEENIKNNIVEIRGEIEKEFVFSHEICGEGFYETTICTKRTSGTDDHIPVMASERLIKIQNSFPGSRVYIKGQFRSYNQHDGERSRLILYVFAREFEIDDSGFDDENKIFIEGYLCKEPIYRFTPIGREITDILLAVNRPYGKSDYIPCILWGRNARYSNEFLVGEKMQIRGRIQSREYKKKFPDGNIEIRTAYEVSVQTIEKEEERDGEETDRTDIIANGDSV